MSYSKAEGDGKDGSPWLTFHESTSIASRCVSNLKSAPPRQVNTPFYRKAKGVFQFALCVAPSVVVPCQELSLRLLHPCSTQEHQTP